VAEVFTPGAPLPAIGAWLGEALDERETGEDACIPTESRANARSGPPAAHSASRSDPRGRRPTGMIRSSTFVTAVATKRSRRQSKPEPAKQAERNGSGGSLRIPG